MNEINFSQYKKFICGYVFMYLNSRNEKDNLRHPNGGNLYRVIICGELSHNDISLTCHECANDVDMLGAFICLIMLQYSERQLQQMHLMGWNA